MDLEKMKKIVQDDFDAQIGIWGSVERAPGEEAEIYDLVIKCVDFSAQPSPKVIYEVKARTNSASEIPHLYVKQMLDALYGPEAGAAPRPPISWPKTTGRRTRTLWSAISSTAPAACPRAGTRWPASSASRWAGWCAGWPRKAIPRTRSSASRSIKNVAENEGVMYYSDCFPVEEGAKYRFQCRWRSTAPAVKVFIKCYDEVPTSYGEQTGQHAKSIAASKTSKARAASGTRTPKTSRPNTRSTRPSGAA